MEEKELKKKERQEKEQEYKDLLKQIAELKLEDV